MLEGCRYVRGPEFFVIVAMEVNIASDILNITEPVPVDESIESNEYREYESQNPAALNNGQAIQIDIQNQDIFTQPSRSFLLVEGQLSVAAGGAYADTAAVSLINNAIPFIFSQIRYSINNIEIENVMNPGQATTMKGMLIYGDDFSKSEGLNICWQKDTTATASSANLGWEARRQLVIVKPNPVGTFSFSIPLKHLFGFCDDYRKVLYGVKQSLILSRQTDNDAIFRDGAPALPLTAAAAGVITLSKLAWLMPHIMPAVEYKNILFKQIESKIKIPVAFRAMQSDSLAVPQSTLFSWRLTVKSGTEKPRWLLVAFQTGRSGDQTANPSAFDHVQVRNIYALLNSDRYPVVDMSLNFTQMKTSRAYKALRDFKEEYYGIDSRESSNQVTPIDFVDFFPIFVLDLRRQSERLKTSVQDIQIKTDFNAAVPANTTAYAVLISDRMLTLDSDGNKFNVIF